MQRSTLFTLLFLQFFAGAGRAEHVPMPPARPDIKAVTQAPQAKVEQTSAQGIGCLAQLQAMGADASAVEQPPSGKIGCRIDNPVVLRAIRSTASAKPIALPDHPMLACAMAQSYALWLTDVAAPLLAKSHGSVLAKVHTGPGHECRNVNRALSGKLSPHATGIAIDMDRFVLADGRVLVVGDTTKPKDRTALKAVQDSACKRFTTVLGPGSNAAHASHIHVDMKQHGKSGTYRICG
jgi:hypothetical protein